MADFSAQIALAKRLIEANGRTITLVKLDETSDSAQPWLPDAPDVGAAPADTQSGIGVFVPLASASSLGFTTDDIDGTKRNQQVCLFAAANDGGKQLEDFDELIDGTERYSIGKTLLLRPAEQRILYAIEVSQ